MISYPSLRTGARSRQVIDTFRGYNHNQRIGSGEFYEMENLTSDDYPVLSTRGKRGNVTPLQDGGYSTGALYVPGKGIFLSLNQYAEDIHEEIGSLFLLTPEGEMKYITNSLSLGPKSLALMGDKLIIAPDMKWVSINPSDIGGNEVFRENNISYCKKITSGQILIRLCKEDGTLYPLPLPSEELYTDTEKDDGAIVVDDSVYPPVLKQYSKLEKKWFNVNTTYVKISGEGLNYHSLYPNDGITIDGIGYDGASVVDYEASLLNGDRTVIDCDIDSIIIKGIINGSYAQPCSARPITIERSVPKLDFIVTANNRLWGCARDTNEIHACKLGDIFNWNCFPGLSTDSWFCPAGTPGEFTGAVVQNGYPVFYKENCKHKIWPSATGDHQMTTVNCNGVEKGSESSLAECDGTVFYKSAFGVFADDGGGTVEIGHNLGDVRYYHAVGTIHDRKYYLSMEDSTGKRHLYIYDIARRMWHCENSTHGILCTAGNSLYCVEDGEVLDLTGNTGTPEETVSWMAVTGDLGLELPEQKYISRLTLRLLLEPGATLEIFAQYDREREWVKLGQVYGTELRSFSLPVRPRRCDQLRLKLQGTGMCKLYSITKTLEKGSELP